MTPTLTRVITIAVAFAFIAASGVACANGRFGVAGLTFATAAVIGAARVVAEVRAARRSEDAWVRQFGPHTTRR